MPGAFAGKEEGVHAAVPLLEEMPKWSVVREILQVLQAVKVWMSALPVCPFPSQSPSYCAADTLCRTSKPSGRSPVHMPALLLAQAVQHSRAQGPGW